ncbi:hypothetical protein FKN01_29710 [Streptomyces sp. 130]|uniref:hypothetical protein n=1 Tax=Streptomyces sp. 130 TaxID=2591006 RepID=UPI00117D786D|nr:hypothetical protein [Streptomyces sp. 130]TRV72567.1 hypothetical protein FKN01_29710 [Streptomyces sp. 130]
MTGPRPFPPAAVAALAAGLDDYRLTTPAHQQTPAEAARRAAEYLVSAGWAVHIPPRAVPSGPRRPCPVCTTRQLVRPNGQLRKHGAPGHPCPGSGSLPESEPAT